MASVFCVYISPIFNCCCIVAVCMLHSCTIYNKLYTIRIQYALKPYITCIYYYVLYAVHLFIKYE